MRVIKIGGGNLRGRAIPRIVIEIGSGNIRDFVTNTKARRALIGVVIEIGNGNRRDLAEIVRGNVARAGPGRRIELVIGEVNVGAAQAEEGSEALAGGGSITIEGSGVQIGFIIKDAVDTPIRVRAKGGMTRAIGGMIIEISEVGRIAGRGTDVVIKIGVIIVGKGMLIGTGAAVIAVLVGIGENGGAAGSATVRLMQWMEGKSRTTRELDDSH